MSNIPGYEELLATLDDESKRPPIVLSYVKCIRCENLTSTGFCASCAELLELFQEELMSIRPHKVPFDPPGGPPEGAAHPADEEVFKRLGDRKET